MTLPPVAIGFAEHHNPPRACARCHDSDRPTCPNCGHALTGFIAAGNRTACEFCDRVSILDANRNEVLWMVE